MQTIEPTQNGNPYLGRQHDRLFDIFRPGVKIAYSSVGGCSPERQALAIKSGVAEFGTVIQFNASDPESTLVQIEWEKPCPNETDWIDACRCMIVSPVLKCTRCGHCWTPRGGAKPKFCPYCNSPYWNKLRKFNAGAGTNHH